VSFFVGVNRRDVLQSGADVVESLEQNFLAGRRDFEFEHQAVLVGYSLIRQIDRQRIAFLFFGMLKELFDLLFGQCGRQDAVLKAVVVENVRVARRDDDAKTVILHAPGRVFAAGPATEVCARE